MNDAIINALYGVGGSTPALILLAWFFWVQVGKLKEDLTSSIHQLELKITELKFIEQRLNELKKDHNGLSERVALEAQKVSAAWQKIDSLK